MKIPSNNPPNNSSGKIVRIKSIRYNIFLFLAQPLLYKGPGSHWIGEFERLEEMKTLVLGIGNLLLGDEGVGVHAARAFLKEDLPAETKVLEIGTVLLDALPELEVANRVIILDAMEYKGEPGTIYSIPQYQSRGSKNIASMHGFDISRVLALAGHAGPAEVLLLGVEPSYMGWSIELSPQVAEALPLLLEAVKREIKRK